MCDFAEEELAEYERWLEYARARVRVAERSPRLAALSVSEIVAPPATAEA
jgi:hypothetical protein